MLKSAEFAYTNLPNQAFSIHLLPGSCIMSVMNAAPSVIESGYMEECRKGEGDYLGDMVFTLQEQVRTCGQLCASARLP